MQNEMSCTDSKQMGQSIDPYKPIQGSSDCRRIHRSRHSDRFLDTIVSIKGIEIMTRGC